LSPSTPGEQENNTFEFAPAFAPGVAVIITGASVKCSVVQDSDPNPQSRVLDSPTIIASPSTGAAAQAVTVLIGNCLAGVVYQLWCQIASTHRQILIVRWNLPCSQPPGT